MKTSTIYFRGRSGQEYCFQVWPSGTQFKAVPGVYVHTKRVFANPNFPGAASHECVSIGATDDLSQMAGRKDKAGAYICVLAVPNAESRAAIELDLTEANLRGWGALAKAL
jgi:hypothetical protein